MAYHQPAKRSCTPVPCIRTPADKTAGVSSRMYGENGWCRASTFTSATSSARVEPFAVAKLIGVLLTRRFVAFAVFSIPSLRRSCSLPVSTNHTHPYFEAGVATVGKCVLLTLFFRPIKALQWLHDVPPSSSLQRKRHFGCDSLPKSFTSSCNCLAETWAWWAISLSGFGTDSESG